MNSFLRKSDQEALDQILASGEFVPCEEEKQEGEIHLGHLTGEQKSIYSLWHKKADEGFALKEEIPCGCSGCRMERVLFEKPAPEIPDLDQKKAKADDLLTDAKFLSKLFWHNLRETYDQNHIGIRRNWEVVELPEDDIGGICIALGIVRK